MRRIVASDEIIFGNLDPYAKPISPPCKESLSLPLVKGAGGILGPSPMELQIV